MKILNESNINRIMSHMKDKDIAMLTAFRTDPKFGLSKKQNRERNKNLENKLSSMGYRGFTKIVGYYNETPEDKDSVAEAEESYIVLNTGSSYDDFTADMISLSKDFNQQSIVIWSHENQKAYLLDNQGNVLQTFNDFSIDNISKGWSNIKGHNITFVEESVDIRFGFTDKFNDGGNWMTAMGYDAAKNKYRKEVNNMNEDLIKELNNIPESDEVDTAVPVTLAAAKEDDKENVESVRKSFKDLDKLTAEFIKQNDDREHKIKGTEAMKKMELMESLFEDYDEKECEKVKDEVLDILYDNGYDVDSEDVQNYAWAAADYICMTRDYGEDYSIEQWWEDTSDNYPEDLEELPMLEKLEEDIDASEDILDMFDFLYKLFSPTAPSGESTIKLPIKNKQKGFRGSGGDEGHDELNTTDYDISVNTDGDLVLKADSKDKFDWVEEACDYLDIKHEPVKENKVTKSKHNFEKIVQVPTDDDGNPMKISEYFEEIGDDVTKYMKPSPALKKQLKIKNEDCKKMIKRTRMNEDLDLEENDELIAKKDIYYSDVSDLWFDEEDLDKYRKLGILQSNGDFTFPRGSKFTVEAAEGPGGFLTLTLNKTNDDFDFAIDDEDIEDLFIRVR